MKFIKEHFENEQLANEFWNNSAFDILDINFALSDLGLKVEALEFSLHFAEPDLMIILTRFRFDFALLKKILAIPEQYVSREITISKDMKEPSRDSSKLKIDSIDKIKKNFDKAMEILRKELEKTIKRLSAQEKRLVRSGAIPKDKIKPSEPKFEVFKEVLQEIQNKIKDQKK